MNNDSYSLPIGTELKSKSGTYRVVEVLGAGGFGITYKVSSTIMVKNVPITTYFAVKEHFMKGCDRASNGCDVVCTANVRREVDESRKDFIVEARRLNKLSGLSQNIVRVNEVFEYYSTAYYVMQYLDGGELSDHLRREGPMTEARALSMIVPIAKAVGIIHKEHLLHLDIKPDNIVLMTNPADGSQYPVLIDFGIAKHFSSSGKPTSTHSAKGASDGYAPMEQYSDIDHFAPEMDVYALGATLFHLLTGVQPKKAFDIKSDDIVRTLPPSVSQRTRNAILAAMRPMRDDRTPTVEAFLSSLEEQYALTVGHVLDSPSCHYRITGIAEEHPSYIVYHAVGFTETGEPAETSESTTVALSSNKTRQLSSKGKRKNAGANVVSTKSNKFKLYELYSKGGCKRGEDGRVTGDTAVGMRDFDRAKAEIPKGAEDKTASNGLPLAEQFTANGTSYFTYMLIPKPSLGERLSKGAKGTLSAVGGGVAGAASGIGRGLGSVGKGIGRGFGSMASATRRNGRKIMVAIGVAAIVCGLFFGVKALLSGTDKPSKPEQVVQEDVNEDLSASEETPIQEDEMVVEETSAEEIQNAEDVKKVEETVVENTETASSQQKAAEQEKQRQAQLAAEKEKQKQAQIAAEKERQRQAQLAKEKEEQDRIAKEKEEQDRIAKEKEAYAQQQKEKAQEAIRKAKIQAEMDKYK